MANYDIVLTDVKSRDEIKGYWTNEDYKQLLEMFDFPDAHTVKEENLREYLYMAIADVEPAEAAAIVLTYKLSDDLNEGQIEQISNDMLIDRISEEYPEISLHAPLFHINQLLFKAYNGTFLNTLATEIRCKITSDGHKIDLRNKQIILQLLTENLKESNVIKRLFSDSLEEDKKFDEAEHILWEIEDLGENEIKVITSEYWINPADIMQTEYSVKMELQEG